MVALDGPRSAVVVVVVVVLCEYESWGCERGERREKFEDEGDYALWDGMENGRRNSDRQALDSEELQLQRVISGR